MMNDLAPSLNMRKPSFSVLALLVTILITAGFIAKLLEPYVSKVVQASLAQSEYGYIRQAASQRVEWLPLDERAFAKARRLERPIMLLIGSPASGYGRHFDDLIGTSDIQNRL